LQWGIALEANALFQAGYTAKALGLGIPDLLVTIAADYTYLAEGDHGVYFIEYCPDQAMYISVEYIFDQHGSILFYQQMQSWDNSNWWLVSQITNWPPEEEIQ
jgi:hypothetical protein